MSQIALTAEEARAASREELFRRLASRPGGLSAAEAADRLKRYGYNEIPERRVNPIVRFLSYFWGPIPWMIESAVLISIVLGRWEDFAIIFSLLLFNAFVGSWQESKADTAVGMLKKNLAVRSIVFRDGRRVGVPARELVPGDVVRIRLGDIVPADVKLVDGEYLLVDESALTGESLPVDKHMSDIAYSGTVVRRGEMNGLVFATGTASYFGRTARLVAETKTVSHFQQALLNIGNYLISLALVLAVVVFIVGFIRQQGVLETLQFALILTVAAIPAALPAVLTTTMAVGAMDLAKRQAIVSRLIAIEELASMDVLCSDKTGTITENRLAIAGIESYAGFTKEDVLLAARLASREEDRDPIGMVIIERVEETGNVAARVDMYRPVSFSPFDPVSKRTIAVVEDSEGKRFSAAKGAPQVILGLTRDRQALSAGVLELIDAFATRGYRALGVAMTDELGRWRFVGLLALYDPPRKDSAETIATARSMGVDVKMVTGDHTAIAREIAAAVNMPTAVTTASCFLGRPEHEAEQIVEEADGFAEVFPEHKYRIVELLQARGHVVGMTGDGVNDAPALKKANVGIAVAGATDAARSSAAIILTEAGLSVIIDAIKKSREIFRRMNNYAIYRITETIRVLFFIALSIVVFGFYPVTALMIVLLALLNDFPIMTIAYDNVRYSKTPERWNFMTLLGISTLLGLIGVVSSFGLLYIGVVILQLSTAALQSLIYLKLSVSGHLVLFAARTTGPFWSIRPATPLLLAVFGTQLIATLIVVYGFLLPPIGWSLALFVWVYGVALFLITDFIKVRAYPLFERAGIRR